LMAICLPSRWRAMGCGEIAARQLDMTLVRDED